MNLKLDQRFKELLERGVITVDAGGATGGNIEKNAATGAKILLSLPTANNIYFAGWIAAAEAAADALGMEIHYENFEFDNARQVASFQNMTNLGIKGAITSVNSSALSPRIMDLCTEQKVYCCNGWSNQPWFGPVDTGEYYRTYMETDTDTGFDAMCTYLFENCLLYTSPSPRD